MDSFIDIVIGIAILFVMVAFGVTIFSIYHSQKVNKRGWYENLVPVRAIEYATTILILAIAITSFLFGGTTNMCIITALVMFVITLAALVYSKCSSVRRAVKFQA